MTQEFSFQILVYLNSQKNSSETGIFGWQILYGKTA